MSTNIVLATGNAGKVREIQTVLAQWNITVKPQSEFNTPEAEETGLSFVENAIIKARNAAQHTGLPALADDSGIEVDFLQGEPGIYSSRYAGSAGDNIANNRKLLEALKDVPHAQRSARFQCVIVFMRHAKDPTPVICQGTWEGFIVDKPQGTNGFGYDPVFYVPTHQCTSAELPSDVKNRISHRGQALVQLASFFQQHH